MTDMTPAEELKHLDGTEQHLTESLAKATDPRTRELLHEGLRAVERRRQQITDSGEE